MKDRITIGGHDGTFAAYIARPKTVLDPAVVVLQELFGANADIRKHCDELAEQGSLVIMGRITMPPRLTLPTVGRANFYISNSSDLRCSRRAKPRHEIVRFRSGALTKTRRSQTRPAR